MSGLALAGLAALSLAGMGPAQALPGKAETGAEYRGTYLLSIPSQVGTITCSGVAVRPRLIMTAAHCVLKGVDNKRADILAKVDVSEGKGEPVIASATAVKVSARYESLARSKGDYQQVKLLNFRNFGTDLANLSDHAFVTLDRPVRHSRSLFDLIDLKAMSSELDGKQLVSTDDVRAYIRLLSDRFFSGNDVDPVFVGYGFAQCSDLAATKCTGSGVRRSARFRITAGEGCKSQMYTGSYFCIVDDTTLPGDSGGALYLKAKDGRRYAVGVLSSSSGKGASFVPTMLLAAKLFATLEK